MDIIDYLNNEIKRCDSKIIDLEDSIKILKNLLKFYKNKDTIELLIDNCLRMISYIILIKYKFEQFKTTNKLDKKDILYISQEKIGFFIILEELKEFFELFYKFYELCNSEEIYKYSEDFILIEKNIISDWVDSYIVTNFNCFEKFFLYFISNENNENKDFNGFNGFGGELSNMLSDGCYFFEGSISSLYKDYNEKKIKCQKLI